MQPFWEIDVKETRKNARFILRKFRMLARVASYQVDSLKAYKIDSIPKIKVVSNYDDSIISMVENLDRKKDAENQIDLIIDAASKLDAEDFLCIYYTYMFPSKLTDFEVARKVYDNLISVRVMQNRRDNALIEFCELYKYGQYLVLKK